MENIFFLVGYGLLLFLVIGLGHKRVRNKAKDQPMSRLSVRDITVIIPFRNEKNNLEKVIKSLDAQRIKPERILFINDHSEDEGPSIIEQFDHGLTLEVHSLPKERYGKKEALKLGITLARTPWILTLDADVSVSHEYMENLQSLSEADMWILPVVVKGSSWRNYWQEWDVTMANAINVACYGWFRPLMASGANLLFKRSSYLAVGIEHHVHISSGDDMFLLRDFRIQGKDIRLFSEPELAVYTHCKTSFLTFFNQRMRWISKSRAVNDQLANRIGVFQFFLQTVFYVLFVLSLCQLMFLEAGLLFICKVALEMYFFYPYFARFKRFKSWVSLPFFHCMYPFLVVSFILGYWFFQPRWKGRRVKV
ncbi:MAG: glycosyltransferase [Flavobacteriales bacterium]|jgi:glycosyltransferase involved in cell wall biosynthesis